MQAYEFQAITQDGVIRIPELYIKKIPQRIRVIVLSDDENMPEQPQKRQLGFLKDKVPPLPDSFFDPLPEEDLQAWGL